MARLVIMLWVLLAILVGNVGCGQMYAQQRGISGPKGDTGDKGDQGTPGQDGAQGPQGPQGEAGDDGAPGTTITMIKFCATGAASTTSFPEYGFCIAGNLYATFSSGGYAWTANIVPGTYSTTTTGLNCNFTVTSGCNVIP